MVYLVLAILFASMFSIVFKVCQHYLLNSNQVILFNYLTALLASWIPILFKVSGGSYEVEMFSVPARSLFLAGIQGLMFVVGFMVMNRSIWRSGVALTTVSARSSLVLPVIFSMLFLGQPAPAWIPVAVILVSLAMIILPAESQKHDPAVLTNKTYEQRRRRTLLALAGVFVCYGVSDFCLKLAQHSVEISVGPDEVLDTHLDTLMGLIFLAASIISLIVCLINREFKKQPVNWKSILGGVALGTVNILCTSSSLRALSSISTSVYYPVYNIGIVIVGTIAGVLFFKEKIKWVQLAGIALSIFAILLFFK